jgi:hypothetical protein
MLFSGMDDAVEILLVEDGSVVAVSIEGGSAGCVVGTGVPVHPARSAITIKVRPIRLISAPSKFR